MQHADDEVSSTHSLTGPSRLRATPVEGDQTGCFASVFVFEMNRTDYVLLTAHENDVARLQGDDNTLSQTAILLFYQEIDPISGGCLKGR